jgi:hypothetical protein
LTHPSVDALLVKIGSTLRTTEDNAVLSTRGLQNIETNGAIIFRTDLLLLGSSDFVHISPVLNFRKGGFHFFIGHDIGVVAHSGKPLLHGLKHFFQFGREPGRLINQRRKRVDLHYFQQHEQNVFAQIALGMIGTRAGRRSLNFYFIAVSSAAQDRKGTGFWRALGKFVDVFRHDVSLLNQKHALCDRTSNSVSNFSWTRATISLESLFFPPFFE